MNHTSQLEAFIYFSNSGSVSGSGSGSGFRSGSRFPGFPYARYIPTFFRSLVSFDSAFGSKEGVPLHATHFQRLVVNLVSCA